MTAVAGPATAAEPLPGTAAASVDADLHPTVLPELLATELTGTVRERFLRYGHRIPLPPEIYPRVRNGGVRLDARDESGMTGTSLALLREQLLDRYGIEYGILIPLQSQVFAIGDARTTGELCRALNDCITAHWLDPEPRLRASISVPHELPELAVREIRRRADDPRFVQVLLPTGATQPLGDSRYWPIYAAAVDAGLPVGIHFSGLEQHHGAGWPSFYLEEHVWAANTMVSTVLNLICEGVFEQFPTLQVALIEGGIGWASALMWSMDAAWQRLRDEVPHLRRAPSEYFREHFWFTTQPIEEPDDPAHLAQTIEHSGMADRIMFSSDYPHWDFDSPTMALRHLPKELSERIRYTNAHRLYRLGGAR